MLGQKSLENFKTPQIYSEIVWPLEAGINRLIEGSEGAPRLHKQTVARRRRHQAATSRTAVNL